MDFYAATSKSEAVTYLVECMDSYIWNLNLKLCVCTCMCVCVCVCVCVGHDTGNGIMRGKEEILNEGGNRRPRGGMPGKRTTMSEVCDTCMVML